MKTTSFELSESYLGAGVAPVAVETLRLRLIVDCYPFVCYLCEMHPNVDSATLAW